MPHHRPPTSTTPRSTGRRGRSAGAGSGSRSCARSAIVGSRSSSATCGSTGCSGGALRSRPHSCSSGSSAGTKKAVRSIAGPTLLRGYDADDRDDPHPGAHREPGRPHEHRAPFSADRSPVLGGGALPPLRGAVWFDTGFARIQGEPFQFATSEDPGPSGSGWRTRVLRSASACG